MFIMFYDREHANIVETSIANVKQLGKDCQVKCKLLHCSHTAKQAHKFIAKYQRDNLLKERKNSRNIEERKLIMQKVREMNATLMTIAQRGFDFD